MNYNLIYYKVRKEISAYAYRPICLLLYKFRFKFLAPVNKILKINIEDISGWYRGNKYRDYTFPGIIKGGDWRNKITSKDKKLKKSTKYRAVVQRFKDKLSWPETDLFRKRYAQQIENGIEVKGWRDLQSLETHYIKTYDKLYNNLKENGIRPPSPSEPDIAPIYIMIDKEGEILYTTGGNHRLYMCIVLGIEEIPVRVWMRHTEWQEKREYILSRKGKNIKPEYRKYLSHPDIVSELPGD